MERYLPQFLWDIFFCYFLTYSHSIKPLCPFTFLIRNQNVEKHAYICSNSVTVPQYVKLNLCMALVQAIYSRFLSNSV